MAAADEPVILLPALADYVPLVLYSAVNEFMDEWADIGSFGSIDVFLIRVESFFLLSSVSCHSSGMVAILSRLFFLGPTSYSILDLNSLAKKQLL